MPQIALVYPAYITQLLDGVRTCVNTFHPCGHHNISQSIRMDTTTIPHRTTHVGVRESSQGKRMKFAGGGREGGGTYQTTQFLVITDLKSCSRSVTFLAFVPVRCCSATTSSSTMLMWCESNRSTGVVTPPSSV